MADHDAQAEGNAVTWNPRRKGWLARVPEVLPRIQVPAQPSFSLGDVAIMLGRQRSIVYYWQSSGKLPAHLDFRGHLYVNREDLVSFVRAYLGQ